MASTPAGTIDIRPSTGVYATYRRLSYKPWFAIAEFVDNSTQSFFDHRKELLSAYSSNGGRLRVEVSYQPDDKTLTVHDNAYGMEIEDFTRALVLDSPPQNRSGRSEFGMGLKTAASWFGAIWKVETTQLGSNRMLSATINVGELAEKRLDKVPFRETLVDPEEHFTKLTISQVRHPVRGRTTGRVLDQLGSMYRQDLRSDEISISWGGKPVSFDEPPILEETLEDGTQRTWCKDVSFTVTHPFEDYLLPVHGWIAIRNPGKQRDAGLVLLRRNRVIVGGPEEGYRPVEVFGQPNMYRSQRLIGELHLDDWPVTQAKDTFDWTDGLEDAFIEQLKVVCRDYGEYAENYRSGRINKVTRTQMEAASERTREVFNSEELGRLMYEEIELPDPLPSPALIKEDSQKLRAVSNGPIVHTLRVGAAEEWIFRLHWQDQLSDAHWMQVSYPQDNEADIFLNTAHPFFASHLDQQNMIELLQKLVMSLALAEQMARKTSTDGRVFPQDFRNYMNKVLKRASQIEGSTNGG